MPRGSNQGSYWPDASSTTHGVHDDEKSFVMRCPHCILTHKAASDCAYVKLFKSISSRDAPFLSHQNSQVLAIWKKLTQPMKDSEERNKARKAFMDVIRSQMDIVKTSEKELEEFKTNYVSKLETLYEHIIRAVEKTANTIKSHQLPEAEPGSVVGSGIVSSREMVSRHKCGHRKKAQPEKKKKPEESDLEGEPNSSHGTRRLRKRLKQVSYIEPTSEDDYDSDYVEEEETSGSEGEDEFTSDSLVFDVRGSNDIASSDLLDVPQVVTSVTMMTNKKRKVDDEAELQIFPASQPSTLFEPKNSNSNTREALLDVKIPKFKPVGSSSTPSTIPEASTLKKRKDEVVITTPLIMQALTKKTPPSNVSVSTSSSPSTGFGTTTSDNYLFHTIPNTIAPIFSNIGDVTNSNCGGIEKIPEANVTNSAIHHHSSLSLNTNTMVQSSLSTPSSMDIYPHHAYPTTTDTFLIYATYKTKTVLIPLDLSKQTTFPEFYLILLRKLDFPIHGCEITYFDPLIQTQVIFDEDSFKENLKSQHRILQIVVQTATTY